MNTIFFIKPAASGDKIALHCPCLPVFTRTVASLLLPDTHQNLNCGLHILIFIMMSKRLPHDFSFSGMTGFKITALPNELLLCILEGCSDLETLKNVALAHPCFYQVFEPRSDLIATKVLRSKIPDEILTVVRIAAAAEDLALQSILALDDDELLKSIGSIPDGREIDASVRVSVAEATSMENFFRKIDHLTEVFLQDETKWDKMAPGNHSTVLVRRNYHTLLKRFEVQQAICLFEILRGMIGRKNINRNKAPEHRVNFSWAIDQVRSCLLRKRAISSWERCVANVVDEYFQRMLVKFNAAEYKRSRAMPDPSDQGIDFFHKHMCK